jgi:hypothetical protein
VVATIRLVAVVGALGVGLWFTFSQYDTYFGDDGALVRHAVAGDRWTEVRAARYERLMAAGREHNKALRAKA